MIRMSHPKHGFHIVYNNSAVAEHEKLGWSVHVDNVLTATEIRKLSEDHVSNMAPYEDESLVRAAYLLKFGKKPHHLMKLENIQKALDDNG